MLTNYLNTTLSTIASYTLSSALVSWALGEFKHKDFKLSKYLEEYRASVQAFAITSSVGVLLEHNYPDVLYSEPSKHGYPYLIGSVVSYIFVLDGLNYWTHRLLHLPWFYRNFHYYHHKFRPVLTTGAAAVSVVDMIIGGQGPTWVPLLILKYCGHGLHKTSFYVIMLVMMVLSSYTHSCIDHRIKRTILTDNRDHLHHHRVTNSNYGAILRIWDWICRTYN